MSFLKVLRWPFRHYREAFELAIGHGTPRRAAKLAAIVGTLLVLINQWEAIVGAGAMDWVKVVLTYCVPYMVSTYTSVSKDLHLRREAELTEQIVYEETQQVQSR
ncbi:nitrate/nitrite transporter NrtS [Marinobacter sp. F3R11]|uniref:nitrate/nitrite transporter NrtS n=1 Tax=Marinobacter sp. F3R11 TaxID=2267231 RepID=UPI000DEA22E4|nr:nitrate/nitrite transporter NrtS [Marinobacter sp. F3R11]RBW51991.1 hypothetical protein DS878_01235 [Marinobacter sp. F3R11]